MPGDGQEGKMRAKLREAILTGFNLASLDQILRDNDMLRANISHGPDFATRVNSLIDVARQEGWVIELCGVLAAARAENPPVNSAIVSVQKWLIDQHDAKAIDVQFRPSDPPPVWNHAPASKAVLSILAALIVVVLAAAVYVGSQATSVVGPQVTPVPPAHLAPPKVEANTGGVAVGGDVSGSTINVGTSSDERK